MPRMGMSVFFSLTHRRKPRRRSCSSRRLARRGHFPRCAKEFREQTPCSSHRAERQGAELCRDRRGSRHHVLVALVARGRSRSRVVRPPGMGSIPQHRRALIPRGSRHGCRPGDRSADRSPGDGWTFPVAGRRGSQAVALTLSLLTRVAIFSTSWRASFSSFRFASSNSTASSSPSAFAIRRRPSYAAIS